MKHYQETAFQKKYPLDSRKPFKKSLKAIVLVALVGFYIFLKIVSSKHATNFLSQYQQLHVFALLAAILAVVILAGLVYWYQYYYYKTYFYNITDDHVVIRKGVIAPREITIPNKRIQDVYVDQDFLDRVFGLYDVHISTATSASTARAHIDGVNKKTAEHLRTIILEHMQK